MAAGTYCPAAAAPDRRSLLGIRRRVLRKRCGGLGEALALRLGSQPLVLAADRNAHQEPHAEQL
jgi:hypothetical protein